MLQNKKLSSMGFSEHDEAFRALQERFRCEECDGSGMRWCWKQQFKGTPKIHHTQLNSTLLSTWATHIVKGVASLHYPPRIPEFDDLILAPLLKKYKPLSTDFIQPNGMLAQPQVTIIRESSSKRYYEMETPSPRKRRRRSPDTSFESSDNSSDENTARDSIIALTPFQKWCQTTYRPTVDWNEPFKKLRQDDVGMDCFKVTMKPSKLTRLCSSGLKEATAERLVRAFKKWCKAGKPTL